MIKLFGFIANIASQTVFPVIKWLDATFREKKHVSTINENINIYSSGSAGGVILELQSEPYKN